MRSAAVATLQAANATTAPIEATTVEALVHIDDHLKCDPCAPYGAKVRVRPVPGRLNVRSPSKPGPPDTKVLKSRFT
jgi:hypothetical protein